MKQDRGPWNVWVNTENHPNDKLIGIQSEDFTHDVMLQVTGDFRDEKQKIEYAEELVRKLNS
jgi:hypothetical protein